MNELTPRPGIKCCKGCRPPKRSPTCHTTCPDYIAESLIDQLHRDEKERLTNISCGIQDQYARAVCRKIKRPIKTTGR